MNPKVIETLIGKIGLTPVQAIWAITLSEKHSLWIANQIKAIPEIFPKGAGNLKKILSWKQKNTGLDIFEYDYNSALSAALEDDSKSFKKDRGSLKNQTIVAVCKGSEFKWVELKTEEDFTEEGRYMRHCLRNRHGNYTGEGKRLFSLRTEYNKPVVTIQIIGNEIGEYCARFNNNPEEQHHQYFEALETQAKLNISHMSKYHKGITKTIPTLDKTINGDLCLDIEIDLPEGFCVNGTLSITHDKIRLPKNMEVNGALEIRACIKLPKDLKVNGELSIDTMVKMPVGFIVNGKLIINDEGFEIPKGLIVNGDLELLRGNSELPAGTKIEGDLLISRYATLDIDFRKIEIGGKIKINSR